MCRNHINACKSNTSFFLPSTDVYQVLSTAAKARGERVFSGVGVRGALALGPKEPVDTVPERMRLGAEIY